MTPQRDLNLRWYLILGTDVPDSLDARVRLRAEHRARLQALADERRLKLAGPLPAIDADDPGEAGFAGSAIVAAFASIEQARDWADADPYRREGVYASISVHPIKPVLP